MRPRSIEDLQAEATELRLDLQPRLDLGEDQYDLRRARDGAVQFTGTMDTCAAFLTGWKPLAGLLRRLKTMPEDFRRTQADLEAAKQEIAYLTNRLRDTQAERESLILTATLERKKQIPAEVLQIAHAVLKVDLITSCVQCGELGDQLLCNICTQTTARALVKVAS